MPMTLDPDRTVTDFRGRLDDSVERYEALYEAVSDRAPANNLKLRRGLTTDLAFRIGTDWELFQHRWHIAAISKSPKTFVAFQQSRLDDLMRKNSTARHLLETANPGSTRIPARLSAERIDSMLDPDGYNITFKDSESWNARAQEHLSPFFAARVSSIVNDPEARCILELLKALRNHVAHGSTSSLAALNGVIVMRTERDRPGLVGARNEPLARARSTQVSSVATYLHGRAADSGLRRIGYLAARLRTIVDDLRSKPIDSADAA